MVPAQTLAKGQSEANDEGPRTMHDDADDGGRWPMKAKMKKRGAEVAGGHAEEDEEEIGVHMWEKRGKLVMEVPWFKTEGHA